MGIDDKVDRVLNLAQAISTAIVDHHDGGPINVDETLGALSTIAADIIRQSPPEDHPLLLAGWEESPAYVRSIVTGKN